MIFIDAGRDSDGTKHEHRRISLYTRRQRRQECWRPPAPRYDEAVVI